MRNVDVQLEDDLTGGPADETVQFGIDGRMYEIYLNEDHAAHFRHRLAHFVEHARVVQRSGITIRSTTNRERSRHIRA